MIDLFEENYKIRVSSRAIIIEGDKILLVEYGGGQYYNFIGGGIEKNETAKEAVAREIMEEAGLTAEVGELVFTLEYEPVHCDYCHGHGHHLSFFFRCRVNRDIAPVVPSHTDINPDDPSITSVAKWVPIAELGGINLLPQISKNLMAYVETGAFRPLFWASDEQRE